MARGWIRFDRAEDFIAVHVGQQHVQHDKRRLFLPHQGYGLASPAGGDETTSTGAGIALYQVSELRVVFDKKYLGYLFGHNTSIVGGFGGAVLHRCMVLWD